MVAGGQFVADLAHGPMPSEPSLPHPAENVPADPPARHGILGFLLRGKGFRRIAFLVAALKQFDDQSHWTFEGIDVPRAVTTNVHLRATRRASSILANQNHFPGLGSIHLEPRHTGLLSVLRERIVGTILDRR